MVPFYTVTLNYQFETTMKHLIKNTTLRGVGIFFTLSSAAITAIVHAIITSI